MTTRSQILNFETFGNHFKRTPLLIAHGLFGSRKNWRSIAKKLSEIGTRVIVVDMRNHGNSFWENTSSYEDMATDLHEIANQFGGQINILGHSMGGKAAMALALMFPKTIVNLVVVDIAPVKYQHDHANYISAMESLDLSSVKSRREVDSRLSEKIPEKEVRALLIQSLEIDSSRGVKWSLNLKALKKNLVHIMDFPDFSEVNTSPTLFIRGCKSNYVKDEYFTIIRHRFPNSHIVSISDAGHWLHVEKQEIFLRAVVDFLFPKQ